MILSAIHSNYQTIERINKEAETANSISWLKLSSEDINDEIKTKSFNYKLSQL